MAAPALPGELRRAPEPVAALAMARERGLSRLLVAYILAGLGFMLLPGTFLGVWNLVAISGAHAPGSVSPDWIQAHGHAQIFGWIGSFILGIGFYSIPKLLRARGFALWRGWVCWTAWVAGVALRWLGNVYGWRWRLLLPASAALELAALLLFLGSVASHPPRDRRRGLESWTIVVIGGTLALLLALVLNLAEAMHLARAAAGPAFPHDLDQRFLALLAWGFLVSFVWGFSARWMPVFLGLRPPRDQVLVSALAVNGIGVAAALAGSPKAFSAASLTAGVLAVIALRLFRPAARPPKTRGVHPSFPVFVRAAYVWLLIAAGLGIAAAFSLVEAGGLWGASRHALTVGFVAGMVFCVGQRILPAFSGMRQLYSERLMLLGLLLLNAGCALRVSAEVLAYQGWLGGAWSWLPVSAVIEMTAVTVFAANMLASFARPAPPMPGLAKL